MTERAPDARAIAQRIVAVFEERGHDRYDEAVTQTEHAAQTAALARVAGCDDALVVASLLHDVGHLLGGSEAASRTHDLRHEHAGADALAAWFGPEVTEPIRHHVDAKRYLCAVDPEYLARLSAASVRSLALQGGPMTPHEATMFEQRPAADAAIRLRRWDDLAKEQDLVVPSIGSYLETIASLVVDPSLQPNSVAYDPQR